MVDLLLVLAHPDDESFVGGGTLCRYAGSGLETALVCMTDGQRGRLAPEGSRPLTSRERLGSLRRGELRRAAAALEIGELVTPGWEDGRLREVDDAAGAAFVAAEIRRLRPEVILTFGPEGGGSGHEDHKAISRWTTAAFDRAADPTATGPESPHAAAKLYWITWPPELDELRGISGSAVSAIVTLGEDIVARKRRAFAEHASQQDFLELYETIMRGFDGREFYHLARSRVGPAEEIESDLFARVSRTGAKS